MTHILITHTHRDHSPPARALQTPTGAPTYGFGPHAGGRRDDSAVEEGGAANCWEDNRVATPTRVTSMFFTRDRWHSPARTVLGYAGLSTYIGHLLDVERLAFSNYLI